MLGTNVRNPKRVSSESYRRRAVDIQGTMKNIRETQKVNELLRLEAQCKCTHRGTNKEISLIPVNSKFNPDAQHKMFKCRYCGAEFDIATMDQEEFDAALDKVIRASHITKMFLDMDNERNENLADSIYHSSFFLKTTFRDAFLATRRKQPKQKKVDAYAGVFE